MRLRLDLPRPTAPGATVSTPSICCVRWKRRIPTSTGVWSGAHRRGPGHQRRAGALDLKFGHRQFYFEHVRRYRGLACVRAIPRFSPRTNPRPRRSAIPYDPVQERDFWERIKDSRNPADYVGYLEKFSGAKRAAYARWMVQKLGGTVPASPRPAAGRQGGPSA
jgi:hypothetical protein